MMKDIFNIPKKKGIIITAIDPASLLVILLSDIYLQ